jgi:hypothetical protein
MLIDVNGPDLIRIETSTGRVRSPSDLDPRVIFSGAYIQGDAQFHAWSVGPGHAENLWFGHDYGLPPAVFACVLTSSGQDYIGAGEMLAPQVDVRFRFNVGAVRNINVGWTVYSNRIQGGATMYGTLYAWVIGP